MSESQTDQRDLLFYFLVSCMSAALITSFFQPIMIIAFLISAMLLTALIFIQTRHLDQIDRIRLEFHSLRAQYEIDKAERQEASSQLQLAHAQWSKIADQFESLHKEVKELDPPKVKQQIQTLIDSNNSLVINLQRQAGM